MLHQLRIKDLGVIADATLEPAPGMTVVTGETGAGKTMVVTGLGILLGARAESRVVRTGAERCLVEGIFGAESVSDEVTELGAEVDGDEVLISRQVTAAGRSRAQIGGVQTTLGQLTAITNELATVHGQAEQIRLGDPERQREVLDIAGGARSAEVLTEYRQRYQRLLQLRAQLQELTNQAQQRAREHDMLQFGLAEIAQVDPQPDEDESLATEASKLQASDDLRVLAEQANRLLSGSPDGDVDEPGAVGLIAMAKKSLQQVTDLDAAAGRLSQSATEIGYQVNDLAAEVASYLADLDADPLRLEAIAERRAALQSLTRKYGNSIAEVLAWQQMAAERVLELGSDDEQIGQLDAEIGQLSDELNGLAQQLTAIRAETAARLTKAAQTELAALAMPHARLVFELRPLEELGAWGAEQVHLMFSANPGSQLAPLGKVASGGELSRVRLALEVVLAGDDPGHVFVFDEVDAGIGGAVATEVGRRLSALAAHSQVIVVTHLAQVAAFADAHFVVAKSSAGEVTTSDLQRLDDEQRVKELARMMGGDAQSSKALAHATELRAAALGATA